MHLASPLLQAFSCPLLLLLDPALENNFPERTFPTCPLAAHASREQKVCRGEPTPSDRRDYRGPMVWTPRTVLPPSSSYPVLPFTVVTCVPRFSEVISGGRLEQALLWCLHSPWLSHFWVTWVPGENKDLPSESSLPPWPSLMKNDLVRLEPGHSLHLPSLGLQSHPRASWLLQQAWCWDKEGLSVSRKQPCFCPGPLPTWRSHEQKIPKQNLLSRTC